MIKTCWLNSLSAPSCLELDFYSYSVCGPCPLSGLTFMEKKRWSIISSMAWVAYIFWSGCYNCQSGGSWRWVVNATVHAFITEAAEEFEDSYTAVWIHTYIQCLRGQTAPCAKLHSAVLEAFDSLFFARNETFWRRLSCGCGCLPVWLQSTVFFTTSVSPQRKLSCCLNSESWPQVTTTRLGPLQ